MKKTLILASLICVTSAMAERAVWFHTKQETAYWWVKERDLPCTNKYAERDLGFKVHICNLTYGGMNREKGAKIDAPSSDVVDVVVSNSNGHKQCFIDNGVAIRTGGKKEKKGFFGGSGGDKNICDWKEPEAKENKALEYAATEDEITEHSTKIAKRDNPLFKMK